MRRELIIIDEMIEAADEAHQLVRGVTVQKLANDRLRRDALLWNMTVLGEATNRLTPEFTDRYPDMPWPQPVRLRNRIIHGYWSIDLEIVHTTAETQLPGFADRRRDIASDLTDEER